MRTQWKKRGCECPGPHRAGFHRCGTPKALVIRKGDNNGQPFVACTECVLSDDTVVKERKR